MKRTIIGLAVGLTLGCAGTAVAKTATNEVPAWQNQICQNADSTDCYNPERNSYIHDVRHLNRQGEPVGSDHCEFFVDRLHQKNDYCRRTD
jgi:hypothetical protein